MCTSDFTISAFPAVCLTCYDDTVNLPGMIYSYTTIPKSIWNGRVLSQLVNRDDATNPLELSDKKSDNNSVISKKCFDSVKAVHSFLQKHAPLRSGVVSKEDTVPLYLAIITHEADQWSYGTVARILSIQDLSNKDSGNIKLTFKSVCRIKGKSKESHISENEYCGVFMLQNATLENMLVEIDSSAALLRKDEIVKSIMDLDIQICDFVSTHGVFLKSTMHENLHLSSPLINILYIQLSSVRFTSTWNDIKKNLSTLETKDLNLFMDIIIAILPTSRKQKIAFLLQMDFADKAEYFVSAISQEFKSLFSNLESLNEYINSKYSKLSQKEKAKIIGIQLKSLKYCLDDLQSSPRAKSTTKAISESQHLSDPAEETDDLETIRAFLKRMETGGMNPEGQKMLQRDFKRLSKMNTQTAEYQQLRNYFDNVMDIPFGVYHSGDALDGTKEFDLGKVKKILDQDHYGLNKIKSRLLEYLCVYNLHQRQKDKLQNRNIPPTILLLDGPPGVGKTSIAKSIAKVMRRSFQRISLGGIYNESDIRGHRRTYVGSMNGLIVNSLKKAQCMNPVILLDELDKIFSGTNGNMASSNNGNPSAALLEVLDPEQNGSFMDHYLGFPLDLSQCVFICTSNESHNIPPPLLDRMETIRLSGYLMDEKKQIALKHLLPKQIEMNGLSQLDNFHGLEITNEAWQALILEYTHEAGVRSLDRKLGAVVRSCIIELVNGTNATPRSTAITIDRRYLTKVFGQSSSGTKFQVEKYDKMEGREEEEKDDDDGDDAFPIETTLPGIVVNGLSYNSDGTGSVLVFEFLKTGELRDDESLQGPHLSYTTGNLGGTLKESINIASSIIQAMVFNKTIPKNNVFTRSEYHFHVPEGGVSKDGPSAGMAITLGMLSLSLNKRIDPGICMTGEITLRGHILSIGGLREKIYGASLNSKMTKVLVPRENAPDLRNMCIDNNWCSLEELESVEDNELQIIQRNLKIKVHYVSTIHEAMSVVWPEWVFPVSSPKKTKTETKKTNDQSPLL